MSRRSSQRRTALALALACGSALVLASPAFAQRVELQIGRGPHYVGESIDISVVVEGFDEQPQPDIRAPRPPRGSLTFQGVSPQVASSITIVNGKITRQRRVTFAYHFRYVTQRPGVVQLAAFELSQGASSIASSPVRFQIRKIATSDDIGLRLDLPAGPLFVGQKVPIAIEFAIARDMQRDLVSYTLRVPLFESPRFRFIDDPVPKDTELQIQTDAGTLILAGTSREVERNGRKYLVVRAERTMIPLEPGVHESEPASVIANQGARFRRDMFGSRQATAVQKFGATAKPASIEIAELPSNGRPASFAGAIGRGYSLEVSADRSVVQVGEPIILSFTLRGDGDLTLAALPPLDAAGMLDPQQFRTPDEPPAGLIDDEAKHFEVVVRVLDAAVREVPAVEYSWFDAGTRRFETTRSRPIALSVGAAEVIGASAVQRREDPSGPRDLAAAPAAQPAGGPVRSSSLALTGADLAVERDPGLLLRDERAGGGGVVALAGLYSLGIGCVALAVVDRRRRDVDPVVAARRRRLAGSRRDAEAALALPQREAAAALAHALRAMLAQVPASGSAELDSLLGECDARSYAPASAGTAPLPAELQERARMVASALEEAGR